MLDFAGEILILTGTPGAGKTTAAAALARLDGSPKVHLHSDDFWGYIKHRRIDPWLPAAHEQNRTVITAFARAAESYASGGYFVVLDGIIGPWFLPQFAEIRLPIHYIVLRPVLDTAVERCAARAGDTLTDPGPIRMLHEQFADLGELAPHALPTGDRDAAAVLGLIIISLQSGAFRLNV